MKKALRLGMLLIGADTAYFCYYINSPFGDIRAFFPMAENIIAAITVFFCGVVIFDCVSEREGKK